MGVIVALLLAAVLAVLIITSLPPVGVNRVVAEFRNAFPLIQGMHVRVGGSIAGRVGSIEVNDQGLAAVTLLLDDSIEAPRSDATAAIRQQDTTGDSYVAYEPGTAEEPLPVKDGVPTIECGSAGPLEPCAATLAAPRFDDLLNAFGPRERAGVRLILSELSRAVDERGTDINRAALELRPALDAAHQALGEVEKQNAALRSVIGNAEAVTSQAASRKAELAGLIDSLDTTLRATASETDSLDAGLASLPATLGRARTTLAALEQAAVAGRPLAVQLLDGAPRLASALDKAPDFLDDAGFFLRDTRPTLQLTKQLLHAGAPTIASDPQRVVTGPFDLGPALANLLTGVLGDSHTFAALFGDDSGGEGKGTLGRQGLGAVTVEPGNQVGWPASYSDRNFLRISAVINCEMFGLPVKPGCLADVLSAAKASSASSGDKEKKGGRGDRKDSVSAYKGGYPGDSEPADTPEPEKAHGILGDLLGEPGRHLEDKLSEAGRKVKDGLERITGRHGGSDSGGNGNEPLKPLLDFLLGD
jgi:ABC-type transporter Mla subunit MlaD